MHCGVTSPAAIAVPQTPFPVLPVKANGTTQPRGNGRIQPARSHLIAPTVTPTVHSDSPEGAVDGATFDAIVSELVQPEAIQTTPPASAQGPSITQTDSRLIQTQPRTNLGQPVEPWEDRNETTSDTLRGLTKVASPRSDTPKRTGIGLVPQFKLRPTGDDGLGAAAMPSTISIPTTADQPEATNLRLTLTPSDAAEPVATRAGTALMTPQLRPETLTAPAALHIQIHFGDKSQSHVAPRTDTSTTQPTESVQLAATPTSTTPNAENTATFDALQPALTVIRQCDGQDPDAHAKNSEGDTRELTPLAVRPKNSVHPSTKDEMRAVVEHLGQRRNADDIQHAPQSQSDTSSTNNVEPSSTATPAIPSQSHLAVPAEPIVPRSERQTPQSAEKPAESAAPVPPETKEASSPPLRSVSLEFTPDGLSDVRLRLSERSGEVHISVHSNDPSMHGKLQDGIHDLIGTLSNAGYDANAWTPGQSRENHQRQREATPNPRRKDTPGAGAEDFGGLLNQTTQEGA